jgi:hypothetical protein
MSSVFKPAKRKSILVYLLIVAFFLLIAWVVWKLYEIKINELDSAKTTALFGGIEMRNKSYEAVRKIPIKKDFHQRF